MANFFQQKVPIFKPKRSTHDLTVSNHITSKLGLLTPFDAIPTDPGDKYKLAVTALGRTMPLRVPVMAQLKTKFAWFHVPYSIVWKNFNKFYTSGGVLALSGELPPEMPQASMQTLLDIGVSTAIGSNWHRSIFDYMDYPCVLEDENDRPIGTKNFSILPLLAYAYIWSEYFVNETIQDRLDIEALSTLDGDVANWTPAQQLLLKQVINNGALRMVNWNKDYLTASRPYTQKGQQVTVPLNVILDDFHLASTTPSGVGNYAPLFVRRTDGEVVTATPYASPHGVIWVDGQGQRIDGEVIVMGSSGSLNNAYGDSFASSYPAPIAVDDTLPITPLSFSAVDSNGNPYELKSGLTINDLRTSSAAQRLLESMAIGGTRITEYLLVQHGVRLSDKTAQRPEFIGGSDITIQIGEVAQTSQTTDDSALARLGGTGYSRGAAAGRKFYTEQAGILLGLMWTKPPTAYMYGVPRYLAKLDALDFMNPHFANLGDQEVYDFEAMRNPNDPDGIFGYLGRYDDLRARLNRVHGDMRTSLSEWHMARNNERVALNEDFIKAQVPTRSFNVVDTADDYLVHQVVSHVLCKKNIPSRSNPKLL